MKYDSEADFLELCQESPIFSGDWFIDDSGDDVFEDDGTLHVIRHGIRACFDVGAGQSLSGYEQNQNTIKVIEHLGITSYNNKRVFVEETNEEDEVCPHCGRVRW